MGVRLRLESKPVADYLGRHCLVAERDWGFNSTSKLHPAKLLHGEA